MVARLLTCQSITTEIVSAVLTTLILRQLLLSGRRDRWHFAFHLTKDKLFNTDLQLEFFHHTNGIQRIRFSNKGCVCVSLLQTEGILTYLESTVGLCNTTSFVCLEFNLSYVIEQDCSNFTLQVIWCEMCWNQLKISRRTIISKGPKMYLH